MPARGVPELATTDIWPSDTNGRLVPSTLFHLGLGFLLAAALLDRVDRTAVAVVVVAVLIPELDVLPGLLYTGAHRAWLNNLWLPLGLGAAIYHDTRRRDASWLARRWGDRGPALAWTGLVVLTVAGIGGDLAFNGVNLFYPVHDQFYSLDGDVLLSTERGVLQSLVDDAARGSTEELQYRTVVDPEPDRRGLDLGSERIVPVMTSGVQGLVTAAGFGVIGYRYRRDR